MYNQPVSHLLSLWMPLYRAIELCLIFGELSDREIQISSTKFVAAGQSSRKLLKSKAFEMRIALAACSRMMLSYCILSHCCVYCVSNAGEFSERLGEVHGPPRVQYLNFCCVLQPGEALGRSRRVDLTVEQKQIMLELDQQEASQRTKSRRSEMPSSPLSFNFLANSGNVRLKHIFSRVLRRLNDARASMLDYFADFDSRKITVDKTRPTTANITKSMGCLSRTQYERSMFNLCKSNEQFEPEDLAILFRKYEKNGI